MPTLPKLPDPSNAWRGRMNIAQVTIDDGALVTMDAEHYRSHQAELFTIHHVNETVANDGNLDILIAPGDLLHVAWEVVTEGLSYVYLYENGTYSGGTALTPVCRNRQAAIDGNAHALLSTFKHTPTVTAVGTELAHIITPGGSTPAQAQGAGRSVTEWLLADGINYLLRITNKSGGAAYVDVALGVYEDEHPYPGG